MHRNQGDQQTVPKSQSGILAAAYVRMSTDMQRYSIDNQIEVIGRYADEKGLQIVKTYRDSGRSGLVIEGRTALQELLADIASGKNSFGHVLVYDISRWGRFQNTDESAFYEYLCARSGIRLHYCAEQFDNDGSLGSNLLKTIKRVMAGEYSRELSAKVFRGQANMSKRGFHVGGSAPYGLKRILVDEHKIKKLDLQSGQTKSVATDRVALVPYSDDTTEIIREIYRLFLEEDMRPSGIASKLNAIGTPYVNGKKWQRPIIYEILNRAEYAGFNVYNKRSGKLKKPIRQNLPTDWIVTPNCIEPIVSVPTFQAAQKKFWIIGRRATTDELLSSLKRLLATHGHLSSKLINSCPEMPGIRTYQSRFGSLREAYKLIGYSYNGREKPGALNLSNSRPPER